MRRSASFFLTYPRMKSESAFSDKSERKKHVSNKRWLLLQYSGHPLSDYCPNNTIPTSDKLNEGCPLRLGEMWHSFTYWHLCTASAQCVLYKAFLWSCSGSPDWSKRCEGRSWPLRNPLIKLRFVCATGPREKKHISMNFYPNSDEEQVLFNTAEQRRKGYCSVTHHNTHIPQKGAWVQTDTHQYPWTPSYDPRGGTIFSPPPFSSPSVTPTSWSTTTANWKASIFGDR